jgi:hypothetical protein
VLTQIRNVLLRDSFVRVESPGDVSLFAYDNNTFIVESFLSDNVDVRLSLDSKFTKIQDLITGEEIASQPAAKGFGGFGGFGGGGGGNRVSYPVQLKPHSFRVFGVVAK